MYRELKLLADLDLRFHAYHPFRFASRGDEHSTPGANPQMMKSGDSAQNARPRIGFSLSSRKPRSSSSRSRFSYKSLPNTCVRIAIVVLAVDLLTTLGQVMFQVPQI